MTTAVALVADWNATPHDRGRWSPAWIAAQAGLRIHSAGPGTHGDIDYLMADCHVGRARRLPMPLGGGDHQPVAFTLYSPDDHADPLTIITWNLEFGRPPATVAAQVRRLLLEHDPDVLALQEAADYHAQLRLVAHQRGYRMLAYGAPGKGHNVLLVRDGLRHRRPILLRLSPRGWRLATGGRHRELYAVSWAVEWLRVVNLHMPPSVNWRRGVIWGPPLRVAAFAAAAGKCVRWCQRLRRKRK